MAGGGYNRTSDLVSLTGFSERTVRDHMREAEEAGWVRISRGIDGNYYYIEADGLTALGSVWGVR